MKVQEEKMQEASESVAVDSESTRTRILRHTITGLIVGVGSFMPILTLCLYICSYIGYEMNKGLNANSDDFLLGYFCFIPSTIGSLLGGMIGGYFGHIYKRKHLGAVLGGLSGPIITLSTLSIYIVNSWAGH